MPRRRPAWQSHVLIVTKSMEREHFFNADGEMLIVAQQNKMRFRTEFGVIEIKPGELCSFRAA